MFAHRAYAGDEMRCTSIAQVVAVDAGDDDIAKLERGDRLRQVDRLLGVERQRTAVAHVAERAAARADVAHDHERGRALAEALADVRARRFLAHGVQAVLAQDLLDLVEARTRRRADANPFRLRQPIRRHDLDRDARRLRRALVLDACGVVDGGGRREVDGHRWLKCAASMGASSAPALSTVRVIPNAASCVTASPGKPHGSISANGARSIAMFAATPW